MAAFFIGKGRCACWTGFGEAKMGLLASDTDNIFFKVGSFFPGVRAVKDLRAYLLLHDREFLVCISSATLIQSLERSGVLGSSLYFATIVKSLSLSSLVHRLDAFSVSGLDLGFDLHDLDFEEEGGRLGFEFSFLMMEDILYSLRKVKLWICSDIDVSVENSEGSKPTSIAER